MEEQVTNTKKRPAFVTVLGILGFIGVGWQIVSGVMSMLAGAVTSAVSDVATEGLENLDNVEGMNVEGTQALNDLASSATSSLTTLGIVNIVAALVCLLGIIWMWGLKKKGFFVYAIGEIAAPIATVVLVGFGFGGAMAMVGMIFPVIFIILWGLNLKHMS
jgi:hypothetical protein